MDTQNNNVGMVISNGGIEAFSEKVLQKVFESLNPTQRQAIARVSRLWGSLINSFERYEIVYSIVYSVEGKKKYNKSFGSLNAKILNEVAQNVFQKANELEKILKEEKVETVLKIKNLSYFDKLLEILNDDNIITHLDVRDLAIDNVRVARLAEALKGNKSLTSLDLSDNRIGDKGAQALKALILRVLKL